MPAETPENPKAPETHGHFVCDDWQESPLGPQDGPVRLARAVVANTYSGAIEAARTTCAYTIAYVVPEDGSTPTTGFCTGIQLLTGTVAGRTGTFVLEERATFTPEGVDCVFTVVPTHTADPLQRLTGSGSYTARHGERKVAYRFACEVG
ncbi:DUF3224 domain-containing protein [Streptomyces albidoflavus]